MNALLKLFRRGPSPSRRPHQPRTRLGIESLENREVPALLTVVSANDPAKLAIGTLRYEVNQANVDASCGISDTIEFNTKAMGTNLITLNQGALELKSGRGLVTINGAGGIQISGNLHTEVFKIDEGANALFENLAIEHARNLATSTSSGGGIYNDGILTLANDTFPDDVAPFGGAVMNDAAGSLAVTSCQFSLDSANTGGAIYSVGHLTVSGTTFSGSVVSWGGAIATYSPFGATLINCLFVDNFATYRGGAILADDGPVTVASCTFNEDYTQNLGGAIANYGTMAISSSTFLADTATTGNAIYNGKGGVLTTSNSKFTPWGPAYILDQVDNLGTTHTSGCTELIGGKWVPLSF